MAKVRQTVIIIPDDKEDVVGVSTNNRKWINRMEKLEQEGYAEEVESSVPGAREWEATQKAFRLPFVRTPREWTDEQREEARERLAGVREANAKKKKKGLKAKTQPVDTTDKKKVVNKTKKVMEPAPATSGKKPSKFGRGSTNGKSQVEDEDEEELDEDEAILEEYDEDEEDLDDEELDDDDEEEEVVVRRSTKAVAKVPAKPTKPAPKPVKKFR